MNEHDQAPPIACPCYDEDEPPRTRAELISDILAWITWAFLAFYLGFLAGRDVLGWWG